MSRASWTILHRRVFRGWQHCALFTLTIDQPGDDMGRLAMDRLTERIDGDRTELCHDVVAPSLVVRSRTGPPRFEQKTIFS